MIQGTSYSAAQTVGSPRARSLTAADVSGRRAQPVWLRVRARNLLTATVAETMPSQLGASKVHSYAAARAFLLLQCGRRERHIMAGCWT